MVHFRASRRRTRPQRALCTAVRLAIARMHVGGTQWMSLSAADEQTSDAELICGTQSTLRSSRGEQKSSGAGQRVTLAHGSARPAGHSMSQTAFR